MLAKWWYTLAFWYDSTMTLKLIFPFGAFFYFLHVFLIWFDEALVFAFFPFPIPTWPSMLSGCRFSFSFSFLFLSTILYRFSCRLWLQFSFGEFVTDVWLCHSRRQLKKCSGIWRQSVRITWFDTDCLSFYSTNRSENGAHRLFVNFVLSSWFRIVSKIRSAPLLSISFYFSAIKANDGIKRAQNFLWRKQLDLVIRLSQSSLHALSMYCSTGVYVSLSAPLISA